MKICIQGLGFVGSAMSVAVGLSKNKLSVKKEIIGIEQPTKEGKKIVESINKGIFPFKTNDKILKKSLKNLWKKKILKASYLKSHYEDADVIIVSINCDLKRKNNKIKINLDSFKEAIKQFAVRIKEGTLIIIESTIPPGTCKEIIYPLICNSFIKRNLDQKKIYLAHSYERVMPGKFYLNSITNNWRVYSGINDVSAKKCKNFFEKIINTKKYPLYELKNTTHSEFGKLLENSYRAVNIALIDEWSVLANKLKLDLFSIINSIKARPTHKNLMNPGFGVGGYCLTKDPLIGNVGAKQIYGINQKLPLSNLAVKINNNMPQRTIEKLKNYFNNNLKNKKILLLGVSYKEDVADTRFSPSNFFYKKMTSYGAKITPHDPLVKFWIEIKKKISNKIPDLSIFDAIIFSVKHKEYKKIIFRKIKRNKNFLIVDANNVLTEKQTKDIKSKKFNFISIGRS